MFLSWLPKSAYGIIHEATRHLLRRPVVGIAAVATTSDDRVLLIRRADTGTWALPGGTLEWGETLRTALTREMEEEGGVTELTFTRVLGVWSKPARDPRFHAVTVGVACVIAPPTKPPKNRLEIREARLFGRSEMPPELAFEMQDIVTAAVSDDAPVFE